MRKRMRGVFLWSSLLWLASCTSDVAPGPVRVHLLQPTGAPCDYRLAPANVETLHSLVEVRGQVGKVVALDQNVHSKKEILKEGKGFAPVPVQFSASADGYWPLDYDSLAAISLYYAIERAHLLVNSLDTTLQLQSSLTSSAETLIVHQARRTFGEPGEEPEVKDNAEYLPVASEDGNSILRNFIFSFPADKESRLPLGFNLGVMGHEYSHLVFTYLFYQPAIQAGLDYPKVDEQKAAQAARVMSALDEGVADYFGFLLTKDAGFFSCSFPSSDRNLSQRKAMTAAYEESIRTGIDFDPHVGGAIWASINYEIGKSIGFENHARTIVRFMATLKDCTSIRYNGSSNQIYPTFSTLAQCHAQAGGSYSGAISQAYARGGIR